MIYNTSEQNVKWGYEHNTSTKWFVSADCVYNSANNWTYDHQITALNNIWNKYYYLS